MSCWSATPSSTNTSMSSALGKSVQGKHRRHAVRGHARQFAGGVIAAANHVASFCKSVEIVTTLGGDDYPQRSSSAAPAAERQAARRSASPAGRPRASCATSSSATCTSCSRSTPWTTRRCAEASRARDRPDHWSRRMRRAPIVVHRHRFRPRHDRAEHDRHADRQVQLPCRQRPEQQRQSRLQSDHANIRTPTTSASTRRKRASRPPTSSATSPSSSSETLHAQDRLRQHHRHPRLVRLLPLRCGRRRASRAFPPSPRPSSTRSARAMPSSPSPRRWSRPAGDILDVGFVGNAAGAIKVGIVGHRNSVEKVPLMKFMTALLK